MLTLAFESSARAASVALCEDGRLLAQVFQCSGLTHSRTLLPMAMDLLKNADYSLKDIDLFAVAQGPGSFTGIRIGVSTVKGLAWAAEKSCVGVSTLAAMAWNGTVFDGIVCAVMDARRAEVYNAIFSVHDGRPERLCPDRAVSLDSLSKELSDFSKPVLLLGDGAESAFTVFQKNGLNVHLAPDHLRWQNAWCVAREAEGKKSVRSQDLLPVYLRLSQAERERQARMAKDG